MAKKNSKKMKQSETLEPKKEKIRLGERNLFDTCLPFERPVA